MAKQTSSNLKVALLVIAAILIAVFGIGFLKGKKLFSEPQFYSIFESAKALDKADKVILNGVEIGKIEDIILVNNYQEVKITYTIDDRIAVPADSKVTINAGIPGFGAPVIELLVGRDSETYKSGSQIPVVEQESLTDKAQNIIEDLEPTSKSLQSTLASMDSVATNLNMLMRTENIQSIEASIRGLQATVGTLGKTTKQVDNLILKESEKIDEILENLQFVAGNLKANQKYIDNTLLNLSSTSDELAQVELKKTIDKADETIAMLNSMISKIESGDGSLSLLINDAELYNNLNNAARDLDRLILEITEDPGAVVPPISIFGGGKKK